VEDNLIKIETDDMKKPIEKEVEVFYARAKYLLEIRGTSEQDSEIRGNLSDALSYLSNGMYKVGIESAEIVTRELEDAELDMYLDKIKKLAFIL